ncbi:hypothetical protein HMPREF1624_02785 [Sporothrix schenckii ATCC 58251]|uniref:Uncharacterized protein n=1 Tax=Sporothrix schenckii (strain ATCC 58251 / de Perez 2211183) TaxID=1391915 RepID=U7Q0W9_SPOS1|nr:hypothetical protein HMPREF1624_02785 [Sporothrix schenckii ATCC 58251]
MASHARGLAGLIYHSFATGLLRTQHATLPGSLSGSGSSHIRSAVRLRLALLPPVVAAAPSVRFFSSSLPNRGKGPMGKATKNIPSQYQPRYPAKPQPATRSSPPTPSTQAPMEQAKTRAAPINTALPRSGPSAVPGSTTTASAVTAAAGPVLGNGFAEQLGRRSVSTLLYEAPSHLVFRMTSLLAGVATITYTLINYWTIFVYPPENMLWWVPHAFAVICGAMIAGGVYFVSGSVGIVRVIQAIPSGRIEAIAGKGAAATAARAVKDAGGGPMPPVILELEIGRVLPILPARKRYILPETMEVPFRFASYGLRGDALPTGAAGAVAATGAVVTSAERVKAHAAETERQAKAREYEMNHLMTAPFRHAAQGANTGWKQVRRVFSREGFIKVIVNGDRQKMDVMGGWALENGRALDRLVRIKNDIK